MEVVSVDRQTCTRNCTDTFPLISKFLTLNLFQFWLGRSMKQTHFMGHEGSASQKHKSSKSFVIREVPVQRMSSNNAAGLSKGKSFSDMEKVMMRDYDTPELVVFLQEDDRGVSARGKCVIEDCESCEETTETMSSSSVSRGSDSAPRNPRIVKDVTHKCDFRKLMMMGEGDHPYEVMDEEDEVARLFNNKDGGSSSCDIGTSCRGASHQSNDSISSTHSFTFPILQSEWSGSPVRMAEADRTLRSTRLRWRKFFCSCCKF